LFKKHYFSFNIQNQWPKTRVSQKGKNAGFTKGQARQAGTHSGLQLDVALPHTP